jgi:hypothetical protein
MTLRNLVFGALAWALVLGSTMTADAAGVGEFCGGIIGIQCDKGLWCDPAPGQCFVADGAGTCIKVPRRCPKLFAPVCGCNGKTFANDCYREQRRIGKKSDGRC